MTFPGGYLISSWRPSRCVTVIWNPQRASTRPMRWTMWRSLPSRRNSWSNMKYYFLPKFSHSTWCFSHQYLMLLLLKHQNYVSGFYAGCLVGFPRKCDLLSMFHAFVHVNLQKFCFLAHFLALALFAAIFLVYHLTWTGTQNSFLIVYHLFRKQRICYVNYPLRCSLYRPTASAEPSQEPAVWSWSSCLFPCRPHTSALLLLYLLDYEEKMLQVKALA